MCSYGEYDDFVNFSSACHDERVRGLHHMHVLNMASSKEESQASVEGVAHEDHSSTFTCPILYFYVGFHYVAFRNFPVQY